VRHSILRKVESEERKRRRLTPLTEELRTPTDWTAPGPVSEEYKPKKVKRPPRTRKEVLLHGLRRLTIILGLLAAATGLIAFLIVQLADTSVDRTFTLAYYIAGGGLLAVTFLGSTGSEVDWYWDRGEREEAFNYAFVYALFGFLLIGVAVLLEFVL
jgi:hypothetical protein